MKRWPSRTYRAGGRGEQPTDVGPPPDGLAPGVSRSHAMSDRYSRGGSAAVAEPEPVDPTHRLRVLIGSALGCVLTSYLLMGTVAALAGLSAGARPEPAALLT